MSHNPYFIETDRVLIKTLDLSEDYSNLYLQQKDLDLMQFFGRPPGR